MTERGKHLGWCKTRALELVNDGDLGGAVASMSADIGKSYMDESGKTVTLYRGNMVATLAMVGIFEVAKGQDAVRHWVTGFN